MVEEQTAVKVDDTKVEISTPVPATTKKEIFDLDELYSRRDRIKEVYDQQIAASGRELDEVNSLIEIARTAGAKTRAEIEVEKRGQ